MWAFGTPRKVIIVWLNIAVCSVKPVKTQQKILQVQTSGYSWALWITSKAYNLIVKTISALCKGNLDLQSWDFPHYFLNADPFWSAINQLKFYNTDVLNEFQQQALRKLTEEDTGVDFKKRVERNDPCLLTFLCKTNVCLWLLVP